MTLVVDIFNSLLPHRSKKTPSGWVSFNAPCCHHRGHSPDDRQRGGVNFKDGFIYHCFNCGYATGWSPGWAISEKLKKLVIWLGGNDDDIKKMVFEALKTTNNDISKNEYQPYVAFTEKELPENSYPIFDWIENRELSADQTTKIVSVIEYLMGRGCNPMSSDFYWSDDPSFRDRVIIPFRYHGKTVGFTARKISSGKPKYLSDQHPNFVFNMDAQHDRNKFVFVTEGPFDALSLGGVALLTNGISDQHARIINSLRKEVIVVPDQDSAGLEVIDKASELGWSVAFPNWEDTVKDASDAVLKYGKLFVVVDAIKTAQKGSIKINMSKKALEAKLKRLEDD